MSKGALTCIGGCRGTEEGHSALHTLQTQVTSPDSSPSFAAGAFCDKHDSTTELVVKVITI